MSLRVWSVLLLSVSLALVCGASTATAQDLTVDFEGLPAGTVVDQVSASDGTGPIAVFGVNPFRDPMENHAVIFDSSADTDPDRDLRSPNQTCPGGGPGVGGGGAFGQPNENCTPHGGILIVQRRLVDDDGDGLVDVPEDINRDVDGATLSFDFSTIGPVTARSLVVIDIDSNGPDPRVELFGAGDSPLGTFSLPVVGNGGTTVVSLGDTPGVVRMVVFLQGSGAIDDLVFEAPPVCGNGVLEPGEQCDDGNDDDFDFCRNDCTLPFCGDGILDSGEQCDDGNNEDGDGCSAECTEEGACELRVDKKCVVLSKLGIPLHLPLDWCKIVLEDDKDLSLWWWKKSDEDAKKVKYIYRIENIGDTTAFSITVDDDILGPIPGSPIDSLAPGESEKLWKTAEVSETTTNVVTVEGETSSGAVCDATDEVTVKVERKEDKKIWSFFH